MEQEIKNLLKAAKEALKIKNFKETLKLCRTVIEKEKTNYNAWLFSGAAAFELGVREQALASYHKAIEIAPTAPSAWQGLAQFYEKYGVTTEILSVYGELTKIFKDDSVKYFEYSLKLANSLRSNGQYKRSIEVYHKLIKSCGDQEKLKQILDTCVKVLNEDLKDEVMDTCVYTDLLAVIDDLEFIIDNENRQKLIEKEITSMVKDNSDWKTIEARCNALLSLSENNSIACGKLLEIYAELRLSDLDNNASYMDASTKILEKNIESLKFYDILHKLIGLLPCLSQQSLNEFKIILNEIRSMDVNGNFLFEFIQNYYFHFINDNLNSIKTGLNALKFADKCLIVKDTMHYFEYKLKFNLAIGYFEQNLFPKSVEYFLELLNSRPRDADLINRYLVEAYLAVGDSTKAIEFLEQLKSSKNPFMYQIASCILQIHEKNFTGAYEIIRSLDETNDYDYYYLYSKTAYLICLNKIEMNNNVDFKERCFHCLLKAIKFNQYKYSGTLYLGNYYKNLVGDNKKALKCYQRTYEMCNNLNICGLELVDSLLKENREDLAHSILLKALDEIPNCKWASSRLGLLYLKQGNANEAIKLFYTVIRNDPNDFNIWECLAEAYLNRGSLTAAMKSFETAIELNPKSNYARYQIASIKQSLGVYDEAIVDYTAVLNELPDHLPTLKGLGETYYNMAKLNIKESNNDKYFGWIELSVEYLCRCIKLRNNLCCVWKLLADCCLLIRVSPDDRKQLKIPSYLIKLDDLGNNEFTLLNKLEILKVAEKNYMMCCKLKPSQSSFWYDLGLSYYYQSKETQGAGDDLKLKSLKCIQHAAYLQPDNYLCWNFMGVLYACKEIAKPELAQHCFIKSLQLNDNNAVLWTNLGCFYLIQKHYKLANECFKKSQSIDPEFNVAWIGQAYIAETVDNTDSIDLYRHAMDLLDHTEAQYGYGRMVGILDNDLKFKSTDLYKDFITFLNAIEASSDSLVRYCGRVFTNITAYFLCGVLFEKQKLRNTALKYYEKAMELIPLNSGNEELIQIIQSSHARVLCDLGKYERSLQQYQKISSKTKIEDLFAVAKVFFKVGNYQQAYKIYANALNISKEEEKSIVYAALGMCAAKFNIQDATTNFYKSFQSKPICNQTLFALCSISLLKNDAKVLAAVFKEIDEITDYTYRFDILKLKCITSCLKKDFVKAKQFISKYVHENPTESKGWIELCLCLKRADNSDIALQIGEKLLSFTQTTDLIFYECMQYLLLQKLNGLQPDSDYRYLLVLFQNILHMFPSQLNGWNLFAKFLTNCKQRNSNFNEVANRLTTFVTCSS